MTLVNNWRSLHSLQLISYGGDAASILIIPQRCLAAIQRKCSTKEEVATECASYYVRVHPKASWTHLASRLYLTGEIAAVEKLKPFLPLRGKHQVISYACVDLALQACTVCVFCHGLHNV